jgi:mannose-6-phosphate isomerase-like protein (cupin superfamily)
MSSVDRPWGSFTILETEENFQIKKLVVAPGMRLSLQSHLFRSEHWFIVSGTAYVEVDGESRELEAGASIDVNVGAKHRISCRSVEPLVFIEVQTGISFNEEDIVRYSDDFGRDTKK